MFKLSVSFLKAFLFCVVFGAVSAPLAIAQQEISIQSEAMQETREIVVHLPKNYDPDREEGYPVIYNLDAGSTDKLVAEIASFYNWADIMPEVIVIGLKNVRRGVDFLPHYYDSERDGEQAIGNGGKLLAYIKDELIPFVEREFKTNGRRVFAGHSWGGQFLTYTMSQSPNLFDAYFITSPAFGTEGEWGKKTFEALEQTLKQGLDFPGFVYVSVGAIEDPIMLAMYYRLTALLKQYLPEKVTFYHEAHDGANHASTAAISIPKAMQLYFTPSPAAE
ncbi:MAG: hypothetical protein COB37_05560 [Kordiimonadales bacterium]|nr:MAG: hypothetical protein COB37_05560 [Kordiimonadales bacterium]